LAKNRRVKRVFYLGGIYEVRMAVRCGEQHSKASGLH
jgi:hypothetical protein